MALGWMKGEFLLWKGGQAVLESLCLGMFKKPVDVAFGDAV